jgi:tRNA(Ile2)-agmatinylcytidine synthase
MFYIGIDDTDSKKGMCTTYLGAILAEKLPVRKLRLIRLNPNIEWKTRGNASICIQIEKGSNDAKEIVLDLVDEYSEIKEQGTDPGVVFFEGKIPREFYDFYKKCLHGIVEIKEAERKARSYGADLYRYKEGRGIIGALAAIGSKLGDRTYEVLAYRKKENWGKKRVIEYESVRLMDSKTFPMTFNNIDGEKILIAPNSPCPVLFGIRGENPEILDRAYKMIKTREEIERRVIYETNQGTDAHLQRVERISQMLPYSSIILDGRVASDPRTIKGGHVIFSFTDGEGFIDCAAYEPTGDFRKIVRKLRKGDKIRVYGSVRLKKTVNLEKLQILELTEWHEEENPICKCGKRMKSAGRGKGFRCKKCKTWEKEKIKRKKTRELEEKIYQVPPRAMRHLSKPLTRLIDQV